MLFFASVDVMSPGVLPVLKDLGRAVGPQDANAIPTSAAYGPTLRSRPLSREEFGVLEAAQFALWSVLSAPSRVQFTRGEKTAIARLDLILPNGDEPRVALRIPARVLRVMGAAVPRAAIGN